MYIEKYKGKDCRAFEFTVVWQGTIHILRQQKGWVGGQKMAAFADLLYIMTTQWVSEWVCGSEKVQKYADVIYEWSLRKKVGHNTDLIHPEDTRIIPYFEPTVYILGQ